MESEMQVQAMNREGAMLQRIKLGHVPDWYIVRLKGGRHGVVRWDSSVNKSICVQFSDKTAEMINSVEIVEIVVGYQELVFVKLAELERGENETGRIASKLVSTR